MIFIKKIAHSCIFACTLYNYTAFAKCMNYLCYLHLKLFEKFARLFISFFPEQHQATPAVYDTKQTPVVEFTPTETVDRKIFRIVLTLVHCFESI